MYIFPRHKIRSCPGITVVHDTLLEFLTLKRNSLINIDDVLEFYIQFRYFPIYRLTSENVQFSLPGFFTVTLFYPGVPDCVYV